MLIKIAVVVVVKKGEKILMYNRGNIKNCKWTVLGGHLELGESIFDCGKREVLEEANIKIKNLKFLTILEDITNKKHYISYYLIADYESGIIKGQKEENINNLKWFNIDNLPKDLYESFERLLLGKTIDGFNYLKLREYVN